MLRSEIEPVEVYQPGLCRGRQSGNVYYCFEAFRRALPSWAHYLTDAAIELCLDLAAQDAGPGWSEWASINLAAWDALTSLPLDGSPPKVRHAHADVHGSGIFGYPE